MKHDLGRLTMNWENGTSDYMDQFRKKSDQYSVEKYRYDNSKEKVRKSLQFNNLRGNSYNKILVD